MSIADIFGTEAPGWETWRSFAASPLARGALCLLLIICLLAIAAPWIAPQNPFDLRTLDLMDCRLPPGSRGAGGQLFLLGTDDQGRDLVSAILFGLRLSLVMGVGSALVAASIGTGLGLIAAQAGGRIEGLIMRLVDLQLSFPSILVALMIIAVCGKGTANVFLALVAVEWAYYARVARASALVELRQDYIAAARGLRLPFRRILVGHVLPNCLSALAVIATTQVARAIALEATLSFLGLGVSVTEPSLGLLIANGRQYLLSGETWISLYPGIALLALMVSINLVGDHWRDALNPRLR